PVVRIGARLEKHFGEWQELGGARRAPEYGAVHAMMEPRKARVRIGAKREQSSCDRDDPLGVRHARPAERVVTDIVQRQPVARTTALERELGPLREVRLDRCDVAEQECGMETR